MNKRKWSGQWLESFATGILLLVLVLSCGFLSQITAESPAAAMALSSRATR